MNVKRSRRASNSGENRASVQLISITSTALLPPLYATKDRSCKGEERSCRTKAARQHCFRSSRDIKCSWNSFVIVKAPQKPGKLTPDSNRRAGMKDIQPLREIDSASNVHTNYEPLHCDSIASQLCSKCDRMMQTVDLDGNWISTRLLCNRSRASFL